MMVVYGLAFGVLFLCSAPILLPLLAVRALHATVVYAWLRFVGRLCAWRRDRGVYRAAEIASVLGRAADSKHPDLVYERYLLALCRYKRTLKAWRRAKEDLTEDNIRCYLDTLCVEPIILAVDEVLLASEPPSSMRAWIRLYHEVPLGSPTVVTDDGDDASTSTEWH